MKTDVFPVEVKAVIPTINGTAVFLKAILCKQRLLSKIFVIYVDSFSGNNLTMVLKNITNERPMTHDFLRNLCFSFGINVQSVVINDTKDGIFFARIIFKMKNELKTKIVEMDARPSDAITLSLHTKSKLFVSKKVISEVQDVGELFNHLQNNPNNFSQ